MLLNYTKIALRNLWKHKTFALVNVIGMSVAFASCLLLFLAAWSHLTFDNFHTNGKQLFMVYEQSGPTNKSATMPAPLAPSLRKELLPEIAHITRVVDGGGAVRYGDQEFDKSVRFVDPDFFEMFSFPMRKGNSLTVLNSLSNIVISEKTAQSIFGTADPVGKTLSLRLNETWKPFVVSGVIADAPTNSSLKFDLLARFEAYPEYQQNKDQWDNRFHSVFVQVDPKISEATFEQRLRPFVTKYLANSILNLKRDGGQPDENGDLTSLRLLPMTDMHFDTEVGGGNGSPVKRSYPILLLVVAGFIVLIACINFINLSTARSMTRSREVGMRKVLGALKQQLVFQFWGEAFILCLISLVLGGLLVTALVAELNSILRTKASLSSLADPTVIVSMLMAFLVITFVAGGYPALFVTRLNTIQILKGKVSLGKTGAVRNTLLIVQFAIATFLMACTLIAWQQVNFLRTMPLGFNENQVVSIPIGSSVNGRQALNLFRDKLAQQPRVLSVTGAYKNFGRGLDGSTVTSIVGFDHKNRTIRSHWQPVDYDYLKTLDIKLLAGRDFSRQYATDTTTSVIINETMAKELGEKNPVGTLLNVSDGEPPLVVIGVVKDYHHESLKKTVQPNTLLMSHDWPIGYVLVKIAPDNVPATMAVLKKAWEEVAPKSEFEGSFLDENTDRQYQSEEQMAKLFITAAGVAIVLSCMGLFAIAIMIMAQRIKEIGVRKVLGASVTSIVILLSKDFLKLVLIGIVIASPLAWWLMSQWLKEYAFKIELAWWMFAVAGLLAILIALVTVSFQSIKAALTNPVSSLRSE
ncbi:ABC transporter permease [Larkinella humicola]|uniref:FtsX-like permease family protein n=1 Tax=Larkinella humicola TaxID=2607654 RepID=A0A5N1JL69_9BACT|nr:ABC transporter permease [Larkinella humicola]KAA9354723.1 FtsX-like permease family protein [Larkinella humicola]